MMKRRYFSPDSIEDKARRMIAGIRHLSRGDRLPYIPARSALLVIDMQRYFLDPSSHAFVPSAPSILPGVSSLMRAYAAAGLPVVMTRHLDTPQDAGLMAAWWEDLITENDPMSELALEPPSRSAAVIEKKRYDAFYGTSLGDILGARSVRQVVICGVTTHLCCETTARSAFVRGFEVFFAVDGTATYNEAFHRATVLNLAHGFAVPVMVRDLLSALGGEDESR